MAERCPVLPDDVIEDILARLPAKTVLRCQCLSHAWAAMLSSDDFVDRHHRLANLHGAGGPRILVLQDSRPGYGARQEMHGWSPDHPGGAMLMEVPHPLSLGRRCPPRLVRPSTPRDRQLRNDMDKLVPRLATQQCRGLVVLEATRAGTYFVFNPSTRQMAALPEGRATGCRHVKEAYHKYASLGIGYDALTRKHKVVRIYYRGSDDAKKLPESAGCEVYVVNSGGGLWRPSESGVHEKPAGWVIQNETSVFTQGHVHWLAKRRLDSPSEEMFILFFSLRSESFGTVPLPLGPEGSSPIKHHLTELGGRLCLFTNELANNWSARNMHVWLFRGHEACTWDLHSRIDLTTLPPEAAKFMRCGEGIIPLAFVDNGHRILLIQPHVRWATSRRPSFQMCKYTHMTGDVENVLDHPGLVSNNRRMILEHATVYEESIAHPGQPHEDIILAMSLVLRELSRYTLARLKLLCRSWRAMIESQDFDETRNKTPFGYMF
ncbi:hypothetical protein ACQ4PT_012181 [Festuca glaucescens]